MDKLVSAIAQFPATVGWNQVQQTLQPILHEYNTDNDCNNNTATVTNTTLHRITPLMVACDKAQIETVRYLIQRLEQRPDLMGHHVTVDQAPTSGNTAIHFACMNDVPEILDILWSSSVNKYESNGRSYGWAALRNAHGDTPIMIVVKPCLGG